MRTLLFACFSFFFILHTTHSVAKDNTLVLGSNNQEQAASINWSEKLYRQHVDGLGAVWTGSELQTLNNEQIKAPDWFVEPLPSYSLEGILWIAKNQSASLNTLVANAQSKDWKQVKFMLAELPESSDIFIERYRDLTMLSQKLEQTYIKVIPHFPARNEAYLLKQLNAILQAGGNGIILRDINEIYKPKSQPVMLQHWQHAQALVVGYQYAKIQYKDKIRHKVVEALKVETHDGKQLLISSGLSITNKIQPPEIGSKIIYSFNGVTQNAPPVLIRLKEVLVDAAGADSKKRR